MTHPSVIVLEDYLRHRLLPGEHQDVRGHLDSCAPCWNAWNRHRWDAAATSPLYEQLAEFLGDRFHPYFDSSRALADEWDAANPQTADEVAEFFRTSTSYLFNLTIWEGSGNRPAYLQHALPILADHGTRTILDYGCGIGSDPIPLRQKGFDVYGCDFHSPSTAFLRWRSHRAIRVVEPRDLGSVPRPDTLWIIDTLDHLTDIEASIGATLSTINLMITENLTINREHGCQRFHVRRTFTELENLFAKFGMKPHAGPASVPVMAWTREW